jgi:hypothetical protein
MLLTNHTLTGALIGLTVPNPIVTAPFAFASHFVLDSLPHTGFAHLSLKKGLGRILGLIDSAMALTLYLIIIGAMPQYFWAITLGVFFATLPDLFYVPEILWNKRYDPAQMRHFHHIIQWAESPQAFVVDVAWAVSMLYFIFNRL